MYAVVDIETTGGNYRTGKIIEVAVAIFDGKRIVETYQTLVNPKTNIPPFITNLTGITNQMVSYAPPFEKISKFLYNFIKDKIFVAHNASFDYYFLKEEFKNAGINFEQKYICTLKEARQAFKNLSNYGLGNICRELNIINYNPHRAMSDVLATVELLKLILAQNTIKQ